MLLPSLLNACHTFSSVGMQQSDYCTGAVDTKSFANTTGLFIAVTSLIVHSGSLLVLINAVLADYDISPDWCLMCVQG